MASPFVAIVALRRRLRFRLEVFFVRMWLLKALARFTFPVPVIEKRFFAPRWLFIFGITRARSFRRENHRHGLPFHLRIALDLRDVSEIGGDPVIGTTHIDALAAFQDDPDTDAIVMIGEIGGDAEERAADYIKEHVTKPVVGYVAGFTAPEGKTMGHAGAIVSGSSGTAQAKKEALEAAGVKVGKTPSETAALMREIVQSL